MYQSPTCLTSTPEFQYRETELAIVVGTMREMFEVDEPGDREVVKGNLNTF